MTSEKQCICIAFKIYIEVDFLEKTQVWLYIFILPSFAEHWTLEG